MNVCIICHLLMTDWYQCQLIFRRKYCVGIALILWLCNCTRLNLKDIQSCRCKSKNLSGSRKRQARKRSITFVFRFCQVRAAIEVSPRIQRPDGGWDYSKWLEIQVIPFLSRQLSVRSTICLPNRLFACLDVFTRLLLQRGLPRCLGLRSRESSSVILRVYVFFNKGRQSHKTNKWWTTNVHNGHFEQDVQLLGSIF